MSGLKKMLDDTKAKWVDELPHMLWTYRTTLQRSTGEAHFSMTYEAEAIIPLESRFPTLRTDQFNVKKNNYLLLDNLDVTEERSEVATVKMAHYQQKLKQGYDKGVKPKPSAFRDLVLRKVVGTAKTPTWDKLGPNWE